MRCKKLHLPFILIISVAAALAAIGTSVAAQDNNISSLAPSNPEFTRFIHAGQMGVCSVQDGGLVPEPIELPAPERGITTFGLRVMEVPPAAYDLRTLGRLTPVRNQGSCGSCWAFASYGSLESNLPATQAWDFSENNMKNLHGFDYGPCSGGNRTMSAAYLARWSGAVSEADDPYNTSNSYSPAGLPVQVNVQDISYIPDRQGPLDNAAIKQAVMTYGAMYSTYYHSDSYYNSGTKSYYYGGTSSANHAICIVGWDDSYSRTNFLTTPSGDGAFIIRNSWGPWWGQNGYGYMSYYDSRIGQQNACFRGDAESPYSAVYQYDPYGWVSSGGYGSNTAWFANVFNAQASEMVAAASWYSPTPGASYTLYVYTDPTNGPLNGSGAAAVQTGSLTDAGYHTVRLSSPVAVLAGHKFSVVVKSTTPGYNYPIPMERSYSGYTSAARSNPGESYMSSSGTTWADVASSYSNTNVCLKAFTSEGALAAPGALVVTPTSGFAAAGPVGGPFTPASAQYTLSNTGGSPLNWTASKGQAWLELSSTSGVLGAGENVVVTATIAASAAQLAAGSYSDTLAFVNTSSGAGNKSLSVTLAVNSLDQSYREEPAVFSWVPADLHTRLSLSDNSSSNRAIPFYFKFYGKNYKSVYVTSNGLLGFSSTKVTSNVNTDLPYPYSPNAIICPYWDDLNPRYGGSIRYATIGAAPNRQFVVTWTDVPHKLSMLARFSFQAILCEGTNDMVFQYLNPATGDIMLGGGLSATIGIENGVGKIACKHSKDTAGAVSSGQAIRFTYQPATQ